ncbi:MAG: TetR family transcriptional regulator [Proteobacteria bacterium]|nr:TetR family transcriptional regulator [Pseudomonadota bacterium]
MGQTLATSMANRRRDILDAGTRVFLDTGYNAASIDMVAAAANISKPTIYKYFSSKEELFSAIIKSLSEGIEAELERLCLKKLEPKEALTTYGRGILNVLVSPDCVSLYRLIISEGGRSSELANQFHNCGCGPVRHLLEKYLAHQTAEGTMRVPDPELATWQFVGMLELPLFWRNVMRLRDDLPGAKEVEDTLAAAVDMMLRTYAV